jgi:hypothetical protein
LPLKPSERGRHGLVVFQPDDDVRVGAERGSVVDGQALLISAWYSLGT